MLGIFKSRHDKVADAAARWTVDMLKPVGQLHPRVPQDSLLFVHFCVGEDT
jgi:hypothetical protein